MKLFIITLTALACVAANAQIGVDAIAKQRAKDVANQNNNRDYEPGTVPTPNPPTPTAAPMAPPPNAAQQAYARFQADLLSIKTNSTDSAKLQFARNLSAVAQANKPSATTAANLSEHLTVALAEANLTQAQKIRIAQEVAILLNSANKTPTERQNFIKDVQSGLETGGASSETVAAIVANLQAVTDEIQKPPAK